MILAVLEDANRVAKIGKVTSKVDGEWALRAETADFISGALLKTELFQKWVENGEKNLGLAAIAWLTAQAISSAYS